MRKTLLSYFAFLHLLVLLLSILLLFKSDFPEKIANRFAKRTTSEFSSELSFRFYEKLAFHKDTAGTVADESILFIGDSITYYLFVEDVVPNGINYGIGGDTTVGVLARLGAYSKPIQNSKAIVLAVGVNDIPRRPNGEIIANYSLVLDQMPNSNVVISSILPVDELVFRYEGYNDRIRSINNSLKELANLRKNVKYIDNQSAFDTDNDGNLETRFHCGDGIHLNNAGYKEWAAILRNELMVNYGINTETASTPHRKVCPTQEEMQW